MTPQVILDLSKRTAHFGQPGVADQPQADLLRCLNNRRFQIWRFNDWDWSLDDISLSVSSSSYDKTLPATTGEIYDLGIQGQTGRLRRYTRREYLSWQKQANVTDTGNLIGYVPLGRDSSGNIKLRFLAAPVVAVTVEGWAKKRIAALTSADLATELSYFPEEAQDVLYRFVLSDCLRLKGDKEGAEIEERRADNQLKVLKGEEESPADEVPQSPPPAYMRHKARNRGKGGTGVF